MSEAPTEIQKFPDIEGFTITQMLSEKGGMADVYLANQHGNDRLVVLKFLRENDPGYIKRFRTEAKSHSQIDHPNVVTIYTVQEAHSRLFIAMEYMQGGDLSDAIKSGMPDEQIVSTLLGVASALKATHALGIIHRDIKPENILFKPDGTAKLSDFGIARTLDGEGLTEVNTCIGTPKYMSPEQLKGTGIDGRSDLYSMGLVLFEMLTGKPVFEGESMEAIFFQKVNQSVFELPKDKRRWQCILNKLLAVAPLDRYQEADELINDLVHLESGSLGPKSQNRSPLYIGLFALMTGALVAFVGFSRYGEEVKISDQVSNSAPNEAVLEVASKILVPYDHADCQSTVPEGIDFVPYLGEDLYEGNCFGLSAKWNGEGTYLLISDVSGAGVWAKMYPNDCGSMGISSEMPINKTVYLPSRNQQPWFYKLDSKARPFQFVSLSIEENETDPDVVAMLSSLPSICDLSAASKTSGFDWSEFQAKIEDADVVANVAYQEMTVNHRIKSP